MEQDEIIIRKGIVHILDGELGYPVFSEQILDMSGDINDFFRMHIYKIISGDDMKKCYFDEEESEVYGIVKSFDEENMVEDSKKIAGKLYELMNSNVTIPSADFAAITFQLKSVRYLAFLKMNYKESFVHMTQSSEEGANINSIIKYQSTLPAASTKLSEAVVINLEDYSIRIIEKKYEINGEKCNYLSEVFLKCKAAMSSKSKLDIVTRAVEQVNKKHFADQPVAQMEAKRIIKEEIEEKGTINVEQISEKIYGKVPEIKEEFDAKMEKYHMQKAEVKPQSEKTTKKFEKQYLKTDTGIEINIPMEQYQDANQVEFITNPDGTISVLIKNINKISTR